MSDYDYADSPGWAIAEAQRRRDADAHAAWLAMPASEREAILAERAAADTVRRESSARCRALADEATALYRKIRNRPRRQETAAILDAAMWKIHMPLGDDREPQLLKMIRVAEALTALLDAIEQRAGACSRPRVTGMRRADTGELLADQIIKGNADLVPAEHQTAEVGHE